MSITRVVNGHTYHVTTNRHERELKGYAELEHSVIAEWFGYAIENGMAEDDMYTPRFFEYRGAWYDSHEFERAGHDIKALGFDAIQTSSYFDGVAICYFDREGYELDGGVIVGHIHW